MKKTLLMVGLAGALYADSKIEGPKLGYVSTSGGIRTVLGIVGASRLGAPIPQTNAVVLPGQDVAFRTDADGGVHRIDLLDGSSAAVDIANVTRIVASPTGETVAAVTDGRIVVVAKGGGHLADLELPGSSRLVAVADTGSTAAVTVADGEGEALYISNRESTRRVFTASKIVAIAFIPKTSDVVFADGAGALYRMNADLQLARLGEVTGLSALAVTSDRLIGISGRLIRSIPLAGGEMASVECSCTASMAQPLGESRFLLTPGDDGPMWVLDASGAELRVAFIPEVVNE